MQRGRRSGNDRVPTAAELQGHCLLQHRCHRVLHARRNGDPRIGLQTNTKLGKQPCHDRLRHGAHDGLIDTGGELGGIDLQTGQQHEFGGLLVEDASPRFVDALPQATSQQRARAREDSLFEIQPELGD